MAKIAVLLSTDFEDSEYRVPADRLRQAGHELTLIGTRAGDTVKGKKGKESATLDASARERKAADFDGLLIPGGYSPDHLRTDEAVVRLVQDFGQSGKPIAAVCHGPQLLIEADLVRGKTVTSWPSVRTDLKNAGANWVDQQVVRDGALITSRKPDDLEAFTSAFLAAL
jgi:protease I